MANNTEKLGANWRGTAWSDGQPITRVTQVDNSDSEGVAALTYVWDPAQSLWVKATASGGGGGGAVTVADGADVALGTTTDASTVNTVIGRLKKLISLLPAALGQTTMSASLPVVISSDQASIPVAATLSAETTKVIGTVNQGTSPWVTNDPGLPDTLGQKTAANSTGVVLASDQTLPLPSGAASATNQATLIANQTNATQQTKITNGTNVADVIASDSGNNAQVIASARKEVSFSTTSNTAVASTDVSNYAWVSVQFTTFGGGTATFQSSNDNATWVSHVLSRSNVGNGAGGNSSSMGDSQATATGLWSGPSIGRFFRINVTGISGTVAGVVEFSSIPKTPITSVVAAGQQGTWSVTAAGSKTNNNAAPGATNVGALVGLANAAAPSWSEGNEVLLSTDLAGNLRVWTGLTPAATALNTYSVHLTANATTTPTAATAYISSIVISNEVGGTTSTITIQDKQGTPLKLVNGIATTALTTAPTVINFQTPVKMVSGIDIITAGAVAATVDVWINYNQ